MYQIYPVYVNTVIYFDRIYTTQTPHHTTTDPLAYSGCIVYAPIHQKTLMQRLNDIHGTITPLSLLQDHRSIHSSTPVHGTHSPPLHCSKPLSSSPSPCHISQPGISLSLPYHIVSEIDKVITAANTAYNSAQVHLSHPTMHIKFNHLMTLHTNMCPSNNHNLSHRVIYHHLLTSARSPLIPRDSYLSLTMDNTTHTLITKVTDAPPTR